ncbi:MAG: hypothetical protein MUO76_19770 [Anaerolineaceae bacterium]|nr:hypothetical protein [Anaerolineaceae bacterium]
MKLFGKNSIWIRTVIQVFFFILVALIAINHQLEESGGGIPILSNASLHALCPFGGVVTIYQYITVGTFVQKIHESSFVLMVIGFLLAILFGPVFWRVDMPVRHDTGVGVETRPKIVPQEIQQVHPSPH